MSSKRFILTSCSDWSVIHKTHHFCLASGQVPAHTTELSQLMSVLELHWAVSVCLCSVHTPHSLAGSAQCHPMTSSGFSPLHALTLLSVPFRSRVVKSGSLLPMQKWQKLDELDAVLRQFFSYHIVTSQSNMQWLLCWTQDYHTKFRNIKSNYILNIAKSNTLNKWYGIAVKAFKTYCTISTDSLFVKKKRG